MCIYKHRLYFLTGLLFLFSQLSVAQCGTTISTFPYSEGFELSSGNWTAGGTSNDWAWGAPSKAVITTAGGGTKCWVTGTLTGSFYSYGERSYVQSPCFDFTNLVHPYITLKVFWESERIYDGSDIQYSLNGGSTWSNVGSFADPINCLNDNWYNQSNITNLNGMASPKEGWSGNIQPTAGSCQGGSGSGAWLVASHCMSYLAGKPSVMFRVTFGAGTTCNNFDGFAFDDVTIGEAPANSGTFNYTCTGPNSATFTANPALCPDTLAWDFGDPGSGVNNVASGTSSVHTFSAPGTYTVSLTLRGPCNAPATITQTIDIIGVNLTPTNVSCFGGNNGAINLTTSGPGGPFSYNWGAGVSAQNRTNLSAGNYSVTVIDNQSCPATASVTISQPAVLLSANVVATNSTCGSTSNGTAAANGTGGTAPYTYDWGGGITSQTRQGLGGGTYAVTVTDNNGCTASASATITQSSLIVLSASADSVACGASTGHVNVTVSGGGGGFTFLWSNGATTQNLNAVGAGHYILTVTDVGGCTDTTSADVTQINAPVVNLSATAVTCFGGNNGTVNSTVTGGTPAYTYQWSNGALSQNITGITAGTYVLTVHDAGSCIIVDSIFVTGPPAINIFVNKRDESCFGSTDALITVIPNGGNAPYTYLWNNGSTSSQLSNLPVNTYSVTVTDASSCTAQIQSIVVSQPQALSLTMAATPQSCLQKLDGTATASTSGGTAPYSYLWSNNRTGNSIASLAANLYSVTVTDANNCTATDSVTVGIAPVMVITKTIEQPVCAPVNNGSIQLAITGGNPAYSYLWSNGSIASLNANLGEGTFYVTVTDSRGCTINDSTVLNYQQAISVDAGNDVIINLGQNTLLTATCSDNNAVFDWWPVSGLLCSTCAITQASPPVSTLYFVTAANAAGCTVTDSVFVTVIPIHDIFIPNAFSPNGDGNNDDFEIFGNKAAITYLQIAVFDRIGEKVFESNDINFKWDGTYKGVLLNPTVLVYIAKVAFIDGYTRNDYKGSLTLVR